MNFFSILKEGDLQSFMEGNYPLDDLLKSNGYASAIDFAGINQHQTMLNYIYNTLVIPYFQNAAACTVGQKKRCGGLSILHWAVLCKQPPNTIHCIIKSGYDADIITSCHTTPLHLAASEGHFAVAQFLLEKGADFKAVELDSSNTPLHLAARNGHLDIVKSLLEAGADVNAQGPIISEGRMEPLRFTSPQGRVILLSCSSYSRKALILRP